MMQRCQVGTSGQPDNAREEKHVVERFAETGAGEVPGFI